MKGGPMGASRLDKKMAKSVLSKDELKQSFAQQQSESSKTDAKRGKKGKNQRETAKTNLHSDQTDAHSM